MVNLAAGVPEKQGPPSDSSKPGKFVHGVWRTRGGLPAAFGEARSPAGRGLPGAAAAHQPGVAARRQSAAVSRRPGGPGCVFT